MLRILTFLCAFLTAFPALATDYVIDGAASRVTFTAVQNGAPFKGKFKDIAGKVRFDPAAPQEAKADVRVKTSSVSADGDEIVSTLLSAEWLAVKHFPEARFTLAKLTPVSDGKYKMIGELDVKGHKLPIDADVTVQERNEEILKALVTFTFKRLKFNVGWSDVSTASADADVQAYIVARAKDK